MKKPPITARVHGVLVFIPYYILAIIRRDKARIKLYGLLIKLTAKGRFEIKEDEE